MYLLRLQAKEGALRRVPTRIRTYHELSFSRHGNPSSVLEYKHAVQVPTTPTDNEAGNLVGIETLYAPWNPADMNVVQGKYPDLKNTAGASIDWARSRVGNGSKVAGSEGIARVVSSTSPSHPIGTVVAFGYPGLGTLRSHMRVPASYLVPLSRGEEILQKVGPAAAPLFQLGGTAMRMLSDFYSLPKGALVIQNAGNSGVGLMVSQLAAVKFGCKPISFVRRGSRSSEQFRDLSRHLVDVGMNSMVVAEEDIQNRSDFQSLREQIAESLVPPVSKAQLGLNAVGGESAGMLLKMLAQGGAMVSYGGMSMQPVSIGTGQLVFQDLTLRGYWHSRWLIENQEKRQSMFDELVNLVLDGRISCPEVEVFSLENVKDALMFQDAQSSIGVRQKVVFDCREYAR